MKFKKAFLCTSLLFSLSNVVMAEDWSGFYIGPQVSYVWMNTDWQSYQSTTVTNFYPDGFSLGPHLGWAYQIDAWVFALESSYSGGSYSGQANMADDYSYKTKVSQLFSLTPFVGYNENHWLFYGKAGYASGKVEADINASQGNVWSDSERQSGWTAGLGAAYKLDQKSSIGIEYDYSYLGSTNFNSTTSADVAEQVTINPININVISLIYTHYFW